jgi:prolyl-tRNA synthetase
MTSIARNELRSYKQLPQIWYQIQTKFRDEPRPKGGLLRVRQFTMKDSYSFDIDKAGLDRSFDLHDRVYRVIFTRCGLKFVAVEADSGAMGGSQSQEFMVYTDAGEDLIASCPRCGYAANLEKATSRLDGPVEMAPTGGGAPELVHTPGCASIIDVAAFFEISPASDIKCVAYMASISGEWKPAVVFLRGDHQVNEAKLMGVLFASELRPMQADEIEKVFHAPAGFLGPIGLDPASKAKYEAAFTLDVLESERGDASKRNRLDFFHSDVGAGAPLVIIDRTLEGRKNMVCGANKLDYHLRNATPGRDFSWTISADIRSVNVGEGCPKDGCEGKLVVGKAVEVGHIFKLGYKYSESMGARVLDENGKEVTPIMGSYGIGIERILTAAIEQSNDANGFFLPASIAPFAVVVTITNAADFSLRAAGEQIAIDLEAAGLDVLLDDRDERAGVKFKDADLIGVPYRINVGKKVASGQVELVTRSTSGSVDVALGEVVALVKKRVEEERLLEASL